MCASIYVTDALALDFTFYTLIASMHLHNSSKENSPVLHYVCACMRGLICAMLVDLLVEINEVEAEWRQW